MCVYGNLMVKVFKISIVFKYILVFKYFNKILKYYNINFEIIDYNKLLINMIFIIILLLLFFW